MLISNWLAGMSEIKFEDFKKKIELDKTLWSVYIVRCMDNTLYCGATNDIVNRLKLHNAGKGAKYININRRPVTLVYLLNDLSKSEALKEEYRIKKLKKVEKESLCKEWSEKCIRQQQ